MDIPWLQSFYQGQGLVYGLEFSGFFSEYYTELLSPRNITVNKLCVKSQRPLNFTCTGNMHDIANSRPGGSRNSLPVVSRQFLDRQLHETSWTVSS